MSERSWPWSTVAGLGDGAAELSEAYSRQFLALYFGVQDPAIEGVCKGLSIGELEITGVATPLSADPGAAICYGLYINDAVRNLVVTTPAIGTTGGRVVLQTNWAGTGGAGLEARTRLAVTMSADGNPAIPALTQAFGTTWEISLATFTVTTGGVITVTDDRTFRRSTAMVDTDELIDLAVTEGKIGALAVTEGKIGALAVTNTKIGPLAVSEAKLGALAVTEGKIGPLAVTEGKIGALAVTNGKIGADAVDDTKVGNRVPQFYRRQGGSATIWTTTGENNYTPTAVRMQAGIVAGFIDNGQHVDWVAVTFPQAYSYPPIVLVCPTNQAEIIDMSFCLARDITITGFNLVIYREGTSPAEAQDVSWLAIGPE